MFFNTYWNKSFGIGLWFTTGTTQVWDSFGSRYVKHIKATILLPFFSVDLTFNYQ